MSETRLVMQSPVVGSRFSISTTPAMPTIPVVVQVVGAQPDPTSSLNFSCSARVTLEAERCPDGPHRRIEYRAPLVTFQGGSFPISIPLLRGGELLITVSTNLAGKDLQVSSERLMILGTNPTVGEILAATRNKIIAKVARQESGMTQFRDQPVAIAGCPNWSRDGLGGVGIMQITNPVPTDDEVWNWSSNVKKGIELFEDKRRCVENYPSRVRRSAGYKRLVTRYSQQRISSGLAAISIDLPELPSGDYDIDPQARELDTIRGYNGWAGADSFGMELHEYRVSLDANGDLVVDVDPSDHRGTVRWERVPVGDRPNGRGDPRYVEHVIAQRI